MADRRIRGDFERRLRVVVPEAVRTTRRAIGWSQDELARRTATTQSKVSRLEAGALDRITLADAARLLDALGVRTSFSAEMPFVDRPPMQHDAAHARCVGYLARQLSRIGWKVRTEVEILDRHARGWADVVAIDASRRLLVGEVKAGILDFGAAQRQLGWYMRTVPDAIRGSGWRPTSVTGALFLLATDENDRLLSENAPLAREAFPTRARDLFDWLSASTSNPLPPGCGLIDPRTRRHRWVISPTIDGRRSQLRYRSYADFMVRARTARQSHAVPGD